ncbi:MAG: TetR/AcrR family transcriptional regulator [Roseitalea sp.]|uniref:TetR/AcrR family transcriptional regulator n=1 Tax=Oceaniradius stylonematis TaxID=2184161 RepID=UPI001B2C7652|nr:TetR/AcrR family transcriptional regulator [Oceaniradius stylonematis]MBO6551501.1 TetR/AcrR family transcriptional regulator [Roseitalea sp.]MBO6952119.1 TetR/AcrR family transcriptional regulator [Rhizobiaceae bacterium]MBO6592035.1 TetR/AcrR family transcriptional regulator [Roseitalea sp.]MBO6598290.1 TetR/AcrR family transcriptional regulator [Roseitalea sp.]MBO6610736.1 TetR/AcrR family transcriptional regulator [Roseitalea sp.]
MAHDVKKKIPDGIKMTGDGTKRGRGRPKSLSRQEVIDLAMNAYWREGPAEVSLNSICQRAGVAKPSLYREFGDEDGLTAAVLQAYADAVLSQVLRIVTGPESFDQKVEDLIRYASEDVLSDNGCLYVKMQAATHRFGEKTQALIAAIDAGAEEAYAALLTDARRTGHAPESIPTRLGARYMMSQITLALVLRAAGEEPLLVRDLLTLALSVFRSDKQDRH